MFTDIMRFFASGQIKNGDAASRPPRSWKWVNTGIDQQHIFMLWYGTYFDRPFYQMKSSQRGPMASDVVAIHDA